MRPNKPTKSERAATGALIDCGVPFIQQYQLGKFIYDFCVGKFRLLIEIDGSSHRWPSKKRRDKAKTELAESYGYEVYRITDLYDVEGQIKILIEKKESELLDKCGA